MVRRIGVFIVVLCAAGIWQAPSATAADPTPDPTPTPSPSSGPEQPANPAVSLLSPDRPVIFDYGAAGYRYKVVTQGTLPGFEASAFDDAAAGFSTGDAPFADDTCSGTFATSWTGNTDILLRKDVNLSASAQDVQVSVAIDNDIQVFWNGVDISVGLIRSEGCAVADEYTFSVPDSLLQAGNNVLAARGRERGSSQRIDLRVTAAATPDCTGEDMSGPPVEPTATPGVRVEYDPRYIVDEDRPDYVDEATRIAETIRDRAQTTLARYQDLGFSVASPVTIRIKCSPAFYGVHRPGRPGITQSDHEIELLSDFIRSQFAGEVVAYGRGNPWSPSVGGWTNLVDHEAFHTIQYGMGFPVQRAALGGDPVTLESTPGTAQDLVDAERDDSDLRQEPLSYLRAVLPMFDEPAPVFHTALDETNREYAASAVFQYWGERFGPSATTNLEQRVASYLRQLLAAPDDRLRAMGRSLDYDWTAAEYRPITTIGPEQRALDGLRDFYVAAYSSPAANAGQYPAYLIRDSREGFGGSGSGSPYPDWALNGTATIGPSGAAFTDLALARAQGGTWEFGVPSGAAEVLVQIATTEAGLIGQDAPLRVGVVRKNKSQPGASDDEISIDPTLFKAGPTGSSVLHVPVPVAGYDTLAVAAVAGDHPVHFTLTAQVTASADLTIQAPTATDQVVVSEPGQLVYAEVRPRTDGFFQRGLTASSFKMWIGGQEARVRFAPELEMLGIYAIYADLPSGLGNGTYDLEVEWNAQHRTSLGSVVVNIGQQPQMLLAETPSSFVNIIPTDDAGAPILISAGFWDVLDNITDADVRATITSPGGQSAVLQLKDSGSTADGGYRDGLYGAYWWATSAAGQYAVTVDATGADANGEVWSTTASSQVQLSASLDSDGDTIVDVTEQMLGLDPANPADGAVDADGDGLSLAEEIGLGTDAWAWDTDGGGESDSSESLAGRDPWAPSDDAALPTAQLAVTPRDGRLVELHVDTLDATGSVRVLRSEASGTTDLGTFPGSGTDLIDGPLGTGDYSYSAIAIGPSGVESAPKSYGPIHVADDVTPPTVRISVNDGSWATANPLVAVSTLDLSEPVTEMRLAESEAALGSAPWVAYEELTSFELTPELGEHTVLAQVKDAAGNASNVALAPVFLEDQTPPVSAAQPLPPTTTENPISIAFTASDEQSDVTTVELWWRYRLSSTSPWAAWTLGPSGDTSPLSFTFSGSGEYEFYTVAIDGAGNREAPPDAADATTTVVDASPIWTWGRNGGTLGVTTQEVCGGTACSTVPVQAPGLGEMVDVDAGNNHNIALAADGTVWTWGIGSSGQLGRTGSFAPAPVPGLSSVIDVAAGGDHSLAVKSDGTVWAWGKQLGGIGDGTTTTTTDHPIQVVGLSDVVRVEAGGEHSLVLKSSGTLWAWGQNISGQLGDNSTTSRAAPVQVNVITGVVDMSGGGRHSIAVLADGTVWVWGENASGQLGIGNTQDKKRPTKLSALSGFVDVAAGFNHTAARHADGTLRAWGYNGKGQLGNGTTTNSTSPVVVSGITGVASIAAGEWHTVAIRGDGTIWGWGWGFYGTLDSGSTADHATPTQMAPSINTATSIDAGSLHVVVIAPPP